jgi:hypothetical protein
VKDAGLGVVANHRGGLDVAMLEVSLGGGSKVSEDVDVRALGAAQDHEISDVSTDVATDEVSDVTTWVSDVVSDVSTYHVGVRGRTTRYFQVEVSVVSVSCSTVTGASWSPPEVLIRLSVSPRGSVDRCPDGMLSPSSRILMGFQ